MTRDAVLPPSHRPRWQRVVEADHGRYTLTHNCIRHGTAFPLVAIALLDGRRRYSCAAQRLHPEAEILAHADVKMTLMAGNGNRAVWPIGVILMEGGWLEGGACT